MLQKLVSSFPRRASSKTKKLFLFCANKSHLYLYFLFLGSFSFFSFPKSVWTCNPRIRRVVSIAFLGILMSLATTTESWCLRSWWTSWLVHTSQRHFAEIDLSFSKQWRDIRKAFSSLLLVFKLLDNYFDPCLCKMPKLLGNCKPENHSRLFPWLILCEAICHPTPQIMSACAKLGLHWLWIKPLILVEWGEGQCFLALRKLVLWTKWLVTHPRNRHWPTQPQPLAGLPLLLAMSLLLHGGMW